MGEAETIDRDERNRRFHIGLARAFGGALIFSLPLIMTMEMWQLGFYMSRARLLLMLLLNLPLLVALSYYAGFEETFSLKEDVVDAFVAMAVGMISSVILLAAVGAIGSGISLDELTGKVVLQSLPAGVGALLAQSQFGPGAEEAEGGPRMGYGGGLFMMAVGALFLAWNLAPTEEMILIAYRVSAGHALMIFLISLVVMHSFMFAMEFKGAPDIPEHMSGSRLFFTHTVPGYAIALLLCLYVLWTFGRLEGTHVETMVTTTIVLGLPAATGAAAARLIL